MNRYGRNLAASLGFSRCIAGLKNHRIGDDSVADHFLHPMLVDGPFKLLSTDMRCLVHGLEDEHGKTLGSLPQRKRVEVNRRLIQNLIRGPLRDGMGQQAGQSPNL